jgi:hypothetical protein
LLLVFRLFRVLWICFEGWALWPIDDILYLFHSRLCEFIVTWEHKLFKPYCKRTSKQLNFCFIIWCFSGNNHCKVI